MVTEVARALNCEAGNLWISEIIISSVHKAENIDLASISSR